MSCKDNKDGSCDVEYTPYAPGPYDVNITYGGQHIPGTCGPAVDWGSETAYGINNITSVFL